MNKKAICEAFCGEVDVRPVPIGWAVKTPFETVEGDYIGFYVVRQERGMYRLADSGFAIPQLEAAGVDLDSGTRAEAFERLLSEYAVELEPSTLEIRTRTMREDELPAASLRFAAFLLRLQDLELLKPETVESTFREDAARAIEERFGRLVTLERDAQIRVAESPYSVDMLISPHGKPRAAVYFASSEVRVSEAVMLHMEAKQAGEIMPIVLLLETPKPRLISERALARALNHLDAVTAFRNYEGAALDRIGQVAGVETRH